MFAFWTDLFTCYKGIFDDSGKERFGFYRRGGGEVCNVPISKREKENANEKVNSQTQLEKNKTKMKNI